MSKSKLKQWRSTVYCDTCNSSWYSQDIDVAGQKYCPQCERNEQLIVLAEQTAEAIINHQGTPQAILKRYVESYLANRRATLAYRR